MRKAKKFLATFLSLAMIYSACSAVCLVKAAAGDYAGMVLNFETGAQDTATGTHPGYEAYYKNPTTRSGNATSYGGFSVGYVTGEGIGHNGSNGAMKMSYSANSQIAVNQTHAAFNVAHTGVSATELKNYRPYINQIFKATVWYKVDALTVGAELGIFTGYGTNLEWGGILAGKTLVSLTNSDIGAGWKSATAYFIGNGYSTATDTGYGSPMYITLKTADDTKRLGTEVYVDDIKVEHVGAAVQVKYELNKGKLLNGSDSESEYGIPGEKLKATAEREGYIFDGWYADAAFTTPVTDVPQEDATFYAKWKLGSFAGMKLNFETGTQDTATGTHPGYEAYYGKPGDAANGNASRIHGFNVGYVTGEGIGHNGSNGAMKIAYSANSENIVVSGNAGFNIAHTGTNANTLANYRPYYGQMFKATIWYKVDSLTSNADLGLYVKSSKTNFTNGLNLSTYDTPSTTNQYGDGDTFHSFAKLTSADVDAGWKSASVVFMGGGTSDSSNSNWGCAAYISFAIDDNTNRAGTEVYIDDIVIEHLGEAMAVNYELDGGFLLNCNSNIEYGLAGDPLNATALKDGYKFAGYFTDADLNHKATTIPDKDNTILYSKWEKAAAPGDLNEDSNVDSLDLALMRAYLLGINIPDNFEAYDMDYNKNVDIIDLIRLKKITAGFYIGPTNLSNSYIKLTERKFLTVGYLGGSVTVGSGSTNQDTKSWRALTTQWLKNRYPNAAVNEVNVSSGSTGTLYGAGRVSEQLMSKNPDIVFVEYAVNDYYQGYTQAESERYMESIVRTIRSKNPYTDIIFVYTTDIGLKGMKTQWIEAFDNVAERYHILKIDLGAELLNEIGSDSTDWAYNGKYFSDSVHPTDAGHEKYASFVEKFLKDNLIFANSLMSYGMPEAMRTDLLLNCEFYTPDEIAQQNEGKGSVENTAFVFPSDVGETIKLKFNGTNIGMAWKLRSEEPEISICIDDQEYISLPNGNMDGTQKLLYENLSDGAHTLTIKRNSGTTGFNIYAIFSSN